MEIALPLLRKKTVGKERRTTSVLPLLEVILCVSLMLTIFCIQMQ